MGYEWITWLANLVKMFGDLIPQRVLIEPTHMGIKYKNMKQVIVLKPGRHWYSPWFSVIHTIVTIEQILPINEETVKTKDDKTLRISGSILYNVSDVKKAHLVAYEVEKLIDDEVSCIICDYIATVDYSFLISNRAKVNKEITRQLKGRMKRYGICIKRFKFRTFTDGIALIHHAKNIITPNV